MESSLFKLMNNSVFGKFLCNPQSYSEKLNICTKKEKFCKLLNSEYFRRLYILDNEKVIVISQKKTIRMNFPHFIGFQILERSKYHMYSLIYEKIYPKLQIYRPTIIYSDTDSIIMYISVCIKHICNNIEQTSFNEFLKVIEKLSEILDTSNMHTQHPCYSNVKRNICGIFMF